MGYRTSNFGTCDNMSRRLNKHFKKVNIQERKALAIKYGQGPSGLHQLMSSLNPFIIDLRKYDEQECQATIILFKGFIECYNGILEEQKINYDRYAKNLKGAEGTDDLLLAKILDGSTRLNLLYDSVKKNTQDLISLYATKIIESNKINAEVKEYAKKQRQENDALAFMKLQAVVILNFCIGKKSKYENAKKIFSKYIRTISTIDQGKLITVAKNIDDNERQSAAVLAADSRPFFRLACAGMIISLITGVTALPLLAASSPAAFILGMVTVGIVAASILLAIIGSVKNTSNEPRMNYKPDELQTFRYPAYPNGNPERAYAVRTKLYGQTHQFFTKNETYKEATSSAENLLRRFDELHQEAMRETAQKESAFSSANSI